MMPFMGWFGLAIGGIPVDRGNRERAVAALNIATRSASQVSDSKCAVLIAPEGTRSTTGHLLPFKKGPFHIWSELNAPIVPMVSYGNYDLYPTGSWVNATGRIIVRYLKPILPSEAQDRDSMSKLLRRRMLIALKESPEGIGEPLSWSSRLKSVASICFILSLNMFLLAAIHTIIERLNWSSQICILSFTVFVIVVTIFLHIYNIHIATQLKKSKKNIDDKKDN